LRILRIQKRSQLLPGKVEFNERHREISNRLLNGFVQELRDMQTAESLSTCMRKRECQRKGKLKANLWNRYFGKERHWPNWTKLDHVEFANSLQVFERMAGTTGLEPAASAVTGQRSNQLNYVPTFVVCGRLQMTCRYFPGTTRSALNQLRQFLGSVGSSVSRTFPTTSSVAELCVLRTPVTRVIQRKIRCQ
jgi:hypothetical protein